MRARARNLADAAEAVAEAAIESPQLYQGVGLGAAQVIQRIISRSAAWPGEHEREQIASGFVERPDLDSGFQKAIDAAVGFATASSNIGIEAHRAAVRSSAASLLAEMNRLAAFPMFGAIENRARIWYRDATQVLTDPVVGAALGAPVPLAGWPTLAIEDRGGGALVANALGEPDLAGEISANLAYATKARWVLRFLRPRGDPLRWQNGDVRRFAIRTYQLTQ